MCIVLVVAGCTSCSVKRLCDKLWQLAPSRTRRRQRFQFWRTRTQKLCQWKCIAQPCGQQTLAPVASEDGWWGSGWVDGTPFAASRASPIDGDACQCTRSSLVILTNTHGYLYLLMVACTYFWSLAATCSYLRLIVCFQCLFQVFDG